MNVQCAQDHIEQITNICNEINTFDANHEELSTETGFLCDAVAFFVRLPESFGKRNKKSGIKYLN